MLKKYSEYSGANTTMGCLAKECSDGEWFKVSEIKKMFGFYDEGDILKAQQDANKENLNSQQQLKEAISLLMQARHSLMSVEHNEELCIEITKFEKHAAI